MKVKSSRVKIRLTGTEFEKLIEANNVIYDIYLNYKKRDVVLGSSVDKDKLREMLETLEELKDIIYMELE